MDEEAFDWTGCEWVERVEGRMSGVPTVIDSRVPPRVLVECFDDGMSVGSIAWNYSLPRAKVRGVLTFAGRLALDKVA
jgi:uncharacterized protein (DUF433 family)